MIRMRNQSAEKLKSLWDNINLNNIKGLFGRFFFHPETVSIYSAINIYSAVNFMDQYEEIIFKKRTNRIE